jgi:hypothetical protein
LGKYHCLIADAVDRLGGSVIGVVAIIFNGDSLGQVKNVTLSICAIM